MGLFIIKKNQTKKPSLRFNFSSKKVLKEEIKVVDKKENNVSTKSDDMMTTQEKIFAAQSILDNAPVKRIKKDKGLIERTESSVSILTEDNKELLKD